VAIEMTIAVASLTDAEQIRAAAGAAAAEAEFEVALEEGVEVELAAAASNAPEPRVHRVVIHVPNSPHFKPPEEVKRKAARTLTAPAPLPRVILAPKTPTSSTSRLDPDQWMRNQ